MGEVGKREFVSHMTGRISWGNTIKDQTWDVMKSDGKSMGVVAAVQRAQEERWSGHSPDICVNSQLTYRGKVCFTIFKFQCSSIMMDSLPWRPKSYPPYWVVTLSSAAYIPPLFFGIDIDGSLLGMTWEVTLCQSVCQLMPITETCLVRLTFLEPTNGRKYWEAALEILVSLESVKIRIILNACFKKDFQG